MSPAAANILFGIMALQRETILIFSGLHSSGTIAIGRNEQATQTEERRGFSRGVNVWIWRCFWKGGSLRARPLYKVLKWLLRLIGTFHPSTFTSMATAVSFSPTNSIAQNIFSPIAQEWWETIFPTLSLVESDDSIGGGERSEL